MVRGARVTNELIDHLGEQYLKLRERLWVPGYRAGRLAYLGQSPNDGKFTIGPRPAPAPWGSDFPNPDMEWQHPTFETFVLVYG
jgi:hypothetical protein